MEYLSKITDFDKYKNLTSDNKKLNADFRPLNFDALLKAGAVRVTNRGLDDGKFDPSPKSGFSLVSAYNDAVGEGTREWPANPQAYGVVRICLRLAQRTFRLINTCRFCSLPVILV